MIQRDVHGLSSSALQVVVHWDKMAIHSSAFQAAIASTELTLRADRRVGVVVAPPPGVSISRDGHTAVVQAGAAASPNEMVRAADDLKGRLRSADGCRCR